jgi:CheY-like chemotaxis protein
MPLVRLPNIDDRIDRIIHRHQRRLPRTVPRGVWDPGLHAPPAPDPGPEPALVLLAEDDAEMRALVAAQLRDDGYEPIEAQNGVELIRALHRIENAVLPLQLIITDIRMPGFDGLEVLEYLRYAGLRVPVIVMTGFGDARTHAKAKSLDAALVLDKPFDIDDLRAAVARLVPAVTAA